LNKKIVITGSYNASIFVKGALIPGIGETYVGDTFFVSPGGKGSNQAIAAKYQHADVKFICKLGNDSYAAEAIEMYKKIGMYNPSISTNATVHTGIAVIFIDKQGNNSIMVVPGANLKLSSEEIIQGVISAGEVFMAGFQLENDVGEVCRAIETLSAMGIDTLLDPAPAVPLPESVYKSLTILKPNEHEAEMLSGIHVATPKDAYRAGEWFLKMGVKCAIITLGEGGAVIVSKEQHTFVPAPKVNAVDTTGAGDIFSGTLLAALSKGMGLTEAVRYANAAASLSVTRMGVFEATPTEEETVAFIRSITHG
jgi:ribokinase